MEVGALQTALANGRSGSAPLQLGAAKTNVGHLEGGAGTSGRERWTRERAGSRRLERVRKFQIRILGKAACCSIIY